MGGTSKLGGFLNNKDSFVGQVIKYILCGGMAVAVDVATFYLFALFVLPALRDSDPVARLLAEAGYFVQPVSAENLIRNFWIIKGICFLVSNTVVYTLNALFVFKSGRHRKPVEVLLFFGSSLFQFFFIWLGGVLITVFNWEVTNSNIAMLITSLAINFVVRKKVVFRG